MRGAGSPLKVRLKRDLRDMAGTPYPEGSVVEVRFALDGIAEVVGAQYLPLSPGEWEPALAEEDFEKLLARGQG